MRNAGTPLKDLLVGFQYYRAPTPRRAHWRGDLERISADGFNTVKFWLQWRWNEPREGEYDFSDIDELMEIAKDCGLKAVLNIILDVAPVWLFRAFPEAAMLTNGGELLTPRASEYRQIGGLPGPCLHHPKAAELRMNFVRACAARYAEHPALLAWDVWNEPELSVGVKREPLTEDLLCYCGASVDAFRRYLEGKYSDIRRLNEVWGRNYASFDEAEAPRRRGTTQDMIDWRLFFRDTITADFASRREAVRAFDPVHPVMCHTVPPPLFNGISCCSDDFGIARIGDWVGNSVGSNPLASAILRSAAGGKPILNSEVHASYGSSLNGFRRPSEGDLLKHIFIPLADDSRGFLFWQYRPEILGSEAPAWGSVGLRGETTPWHESLRLITAFLMGERDLILRAKRGPGRAGVCYDRTGEIYAWNTTGSCALFQDSFLGAFGELYRRNADVGVFPESEIRRELLSRFELVWFPSSFCFSREKTREVEAYLRAGGTAVFEAFAGSVDEGTGMHDDRIPGCGLSELAGVELEGICSTSMIENAYDMKVVMPDSEAVPVDCGGERGYGEKFLLKYRTGSDAEILARFRDGSPAAIRVPVGAGSLILLATLYSCGMRRHGGSADLLKSALPVQSWKKSLPPSLRADLVGTPDDGILILQNLGKERRTFSLPFPSGADEGGPAACDVFKRCGREGDGTYTLEGDGIAVFRIKTDEKERGGPKKVRSPKNG